MSVGTWRARPWAAISCRDRRAFGSWLALSCAMDLAAAHEEQLPLRVIPKVSLGEPALESLVDLLEERAKTPASLVLQVRMDGSIGWPTVIVQYDTTAHSAAIIAAAAMIFEGVMDYDMHSGKKIAKSVLASVVPVGSEAEARLLGEGKPLSQTLLIIREWGHVYTQGQPHAEHMAQIAQHARDGLRAATGQDVQLQGPASAQKPRCLSGSLAASTPLRTGACSAGWVCFAMGAAPGR